ncbi:MAG TPA: LuxR C-terminal-related transcriptional regulator [Candidatus Dormibacteraeota bacterium]|jgi:DNA-binding CsgD family transcriptional regulator|nr:LuxR C-terminal-related transcriptional regulator [Candidatus Dormibacteraeota bacterium]
MTTKLLPLGSLRRLCSVAGETTSLADGVIAELGAAIGFDCAFFATTDPASLLYTSAVRRDMPVGASAAFMRTEFGADDVNQVRQLARARLPVGWLDETTRGDRRRSLRYREAMLPFGLGDEMRVALRTGDTCWGLLCLHRGATASGFRRTHADLLRRLAPHLAAAVRRDVVAERAAMTDADADGPGIIVVAPDRSVHSTTGAGARWLEELSELDTPRTTHPTVLRAVIEALDQRGGVASAAARVRAPSGHWLSITGAHLRPADGWVALVIEPAAPAVLAPLIVAAYGLTSREREVCQLLLQGLARKEISSRLRISLHTTGDHTKSVFAKTGTNSAAQLRSRIFASHFAPPGRSGAGAGPTVR